jgi:hypothetical protein
VDGEPSPTMTPSEEKRPSTNSFIPARPRTLV